ncbi:b77892ca-c3fe-43f1-aab5-06f61830950d [Thermothielavioides terrestris]|uniref:B77892ca-c3fe-43f1-aab5-06f61830950d n=1 Tax=Thermothielavioides terrestris TaxID=2587410 RepID=A0A446BY58_9PEZI|nr:b77892ca-c3fe-43f1-aab5-06f61830950d [Thermothielavioides terrestris]
MTEGDDNDLTYLANTLTSDNPNLLSSQFLELTTGSVQRELIISSNITETITEGDDDDLLYLGDTHFSQLLELTTGGVLSSQLLELTAGGVQREPTISSNTKEMATEAD